jgi:signal transduction histidine kinase
MTRPHRPRLRGPRLSDVTKRSLRVALAATAIVAVAYLAISASVVMLVTRNLTDQIDQNLTYQLKQIAAPPDDDDNGSGGPPQDRPLPDAQTYFWVLYPDGTYKTNAAYQGQYVPLPNNYATITTPQNGSVDGTDLRLAGQQVGSGYVVVGQPLKPVSDTEASTIGNAAEVAPILLLVVFVGSVLIGRRVATPVERARRRQLEFTADASHELRTPLSVIEANTSLALTQPRDEQWYQEAFLRVDSESKRMRRLLEDMLWLARFDATRGTPHAEPVDVAVLAGATADRFGAVAEARQLELLVQSSVPDAVVNVPPEWLDRLLGVLLDNALKFSQSGGDVRVSVGLDGNRVQLTVDDSGPGIPEDERSRVFDRFHRGTESKSGAGLGLAIADAIVRATDGRWRIGSSPSGGASMSVSWPRAFSGPRESTVRQPAQGGEQAV